jgi:Uma2 family endonuclease
MSAAALAAPELPLASPVPENVEETYFKERGKPMPGSEHAICQMSLGFQFMKSSEHLVLSELNLDLDGKRMVPDLCVYRRQDEASVRNLTWVTTPPLIAVEIISPSQTIEEMTAKIEMLLAAGVPSVWLLIPFARVITIYQKSAPLLSATTGLLTDPVSGITVNVDEVFA